MAFMSTDRFGNQTATIAIIDKKDTGFGHGYIEIGSQLFKVEVSPASSGKETRNGNPITNWVKLTKVKKRGQRGSGNTRKRGF